ncbi:hypothetical protein [Vreelandella sp. V005]
MKVDLFPLIAVISDEWMSKVGQHARLFGYFYAMFWLSIKFTGD